MHATRMRGFLMQPSEHTSLFERLNPAQEITPDEFVTAIKFDCEHGKCVTDKVIAIFRQVRERLSADQLCDIFHDVAILAGREISYPPRVGPGLTLCEELIQELGKRDESTKTLRELSPSRLRRSPAAANVR